MRLRESAPEPFVPVLRNLFYTVGMAPSSMTISAPWRWVASSSVKLTGGK